jgi:hypothetical protein
MAVDGIKRLSVLGATGVSVVFAAYNGWLSSRHLAPDGVLFLRTDSSLSRFWQLGSWQTRKSGGALCSTTGITHSLYSLCTRLTI